MIEENFDYLIILSTLSINSEIIELNWCCYNTEKKTVNAESSFMIKPNNFNQNFYTINQNFLSLNSISQQNLESAEESHEVLKNFNAFIHENYINKKYSIAFVVKEKATMDEIINTFNLNQENKNIPIFQNLSKYFILTEEFKKFYKLQEDKSLNEILAYLSLKQNDNSRPSIMELNTLARIVNRMIKDGHVFKIKIEKGSKNTSESILPSNAWFKSSRYYIRFKNLSSYFNVKNLKDILCNYNLSEESIIFAYDIFGRKTGDAIIRINNDQDYREIICSCKFKALSENEHLKLIDVEKCSESEFISLSKNQGNLNLTDKKIFLKMKNTPNLIREDDIKHFFKKYYVTEKGIKMLKNRKGVFLGECIIAFLNEEQCSKALKEKNGETLMNQ